MRTASWTRGTCTSSWGCRRTSTSPRCSSSSATMTMTALRTGNLQRRTELLGCRRVLEDSRLSRLGPHRHNEPSRRVVAVRYYLEGRTLVGTRPVARARHPHPPPGLQACSALLGGNRRGGRRDTLGLRGMACMSPSAPARDTRPAGLAGPRGGQCRRRAPPSPGRHRQGRPPSSPSKPSSLLCATCKADERIFTDRSSCDLRNQGCAPYVASVECKQTIWRRTVVGLDSPHHP